MPEDKVEYPDFLNVMVWREMVVRSILNTAEREFTKRHPEIPGGMTEYTGLSILQSADIMHMQPTDVLQDFARSYNLPTLHESLALISNQNGNSNESNG